MTRPAISYVLATAGHVDHGKSALVRALTGTDPDRLPEEKARGITIDLGFAHLKLASTPHDFEVGLVDVPGHEDFVKNMVAGVGAVDGALLVVAADDGWMPQTQEHLDILTYMGVRTGVVALTKADLSGDIAAAVAAVRVRLRGSPLADAAIVPTSVRDGRGVAGLEAALVNLLERTQRPADLGRPRVAVDRVFSGRGVGTIVTGTLTGGTLRRGQQVVLRPSGAVSKVRGVQTYHRAVDAAPPGSRVALNVPDLPDAARGDVVTIAGVGVVTDAVDVLLSRTAGDAGPLRDGVRVRLHAGAAAVVARLRIRDGNPLAAGAHTVARLTLARPLHLVIGDRFVLRSDSQLQTLAGGTVLDVAPPRGRRRSRQAVVLDARAATPDDVVVFIRSQLGRDGFADPASLKAAFDASAEEFAAAVTSLQDNKTLVSVGGLLSSAEAWAALQAEVATAVDRWHAAHSDERGLPLASLRAMVKKPLDAAGVMAGADGVADALLTALCAAGFARSETVLHRVGHRAALPAPLQAIGDALRQQLAARAFDPPGRKTLCPTAAAAQAMHFLIRSGDVIDLGGDVVMSASAYLEAVQRIRDYLASGPAATVSELKTLLGSSRRLVVPLLERLDRERVTLRRGDTRTLLP